MENGYKILWTDHALQELNTIIAFLEIYWTEKELQKLAIHLEKTLALISQNPYLFQESNEKKNVRRAIILKLNTLYYRIHENRSIEIISFFSNRQNPKNKKLQ